MSQDSSEWKRCSSCKKNIPFGSKYFVCSVSTCRHKRKGFQFCSVPCWDAHLGYANHREAWAIEETAPAKSDQLKEASVESVSSSIQRAPLRKVVGSLNETPTASLSDSSKIDTDILVVVSKVKKLIKDQSGFNTSQCCVDALTKKVIAECLKGIDSAKKAERKTVMGRDIK